MTRADWLNAVQASLQGLQSINLALIMLHGNPYITAIIGGVIAAGSMFVHLMAMGTPVPGQVIEQPK